MKAVGGAIGVGACANIMRENPLYRIEDSYPILHFLSETEEEEAGNDCLFLVIADIVSPVTNSQSGHVGAQFTHFAATRQSEQFVKHSWMEVELKPPYLLDTFLSPQSTLIQINSTQIPSISRRARSSLIVQCQLEWSRLSPLAHHSHA